MSLAIAETFSTHLTLSTRLVCELGDPRSTLRATTDRSGQAVVIHAGGEIDACNERTWHRLVTEAATTATAPGPFVVDVTEVDFMACCAYAVLVEAAEQCHERGVELRLVSRAPIVARIVQACGLDSLLPIYPSVDAALTGR
ncbi:MULTISPECIES: anti-sigma factor antagonist [Mycobacterium]|uniref:Anti-sigma factor antagonist n=1 Tax=Mycobacterium kiyosense TaxID=2871094 RepID=A0A9P3Q5B4_9MYCO|nr:MULTISPECIES: anti-sigma factor antagonist [Mycobacterium]BDB43280.1 anti-sigma factor antagonist [Mycobacterium kiyosense]BDE13522.1 anti-sigma factor antagonist [Mycobacterium sp. 20KCMC460]GLB84140.1 anti-sigma factor antagonist [Mycobacterium kiyosense]GLB88455.1 anti-sigma factor antagonist [Mycobacterium kiyosense]GLB94620.1 anti-sigma factor antagonist [Mycobacterium kiyosense]